MVSKMKKLIRILSVGLMALAPLIVSSSAYAAPAANLYFSPASGSYTNGSSISVGLYENSGSDSVNAASITVNYPTNLLSVSTSDITNTNEWSINAKTTASGGTVALDRAATPLTSITGASLIATVRFHVIAASGTANLSYSFNSGDYNCGGQAPATPCSSSGSKITSSQSNKNILSSVSGASFSIATTGNPNPPPPSPGGSNPSPSPSPSSHPSSPSPSSSSSRSSSSGKDTSAPVISSISVTNINTNAATVTWTTSEPSTSEVDYSLRSDTNYSLTLTDTNLATSHRLVFDSSLLSPGTEYHFVVKSADAAGNVASSGDQTFVTTGLMMEVTVLDQHKKPVPQAKVTIDHSTVVTGADGRAIMTGLKLGSATATVEYKNSRTVTTVIVKPPTDESLNTAPPVTLTIVKSTSHLIYIIPAIVLLLLVIFFAAKARSRRGGGGGGGQDTKDLRQFISGATLTGNGSNNTPAATPPAATNSGSNNIIRPTSPPHEL
jgi:hypothetical protein